MLILVMEDKLDDGVIGCMKLWIVVVKLYLVLLLIIVFVFWIIDIGRVRVMVCVWFV